MNRSVFWFVVATGAGLAFGFLIGLESLAKRIQALENPVVQAGDRVSIPVSRSAGLKVNGGGKITGAAGLVFHGGGTIAIPPVPSFDEKRSFNAGWVAYAIDSHAVDNYHRRAAALPDDGDANALAEIWREEVARAEKAQADWDALTPQQQHDYPCEPFWKKGRGEPRRLSRSQQSNLIEALRKASP